MEEVTGGADGRVLILDQGPEESRCWQVIGGIGSLLADLGGMWFLGSTQQNMPSPTGRAFQSSLWCLQDPRGARHDFAAAPDQTSEIQKHTRSKFLGFEVFRCRCSQLHVRVPTLKSFNPFSDEPNLERQFQATSICQ